MQVEGGSVNPTTVLTYHHYWIDAGRDRLETDTIHVGQVQMKSPDPIVLYKWTLSVRQSHYHRQGVPEDTRRRGRNCLQYYTTLLFGHSAILV